MRKAIDYGDNSFIHFIGNINGVSIRIYRDNNNEILLVTEDAFDEYMIEYFKELIKNNSNVFCKPQIADLKLVIGDEILYIILCISWYDESITGDETLYMANIKIANRENIDYIRGVNFMMIILIAAFIVVLILASFTMSGIFIEGSSPETRAQSLKTTESIARIGVRYC